MLQSSSSEVYLGRRPTEVVVTTRHPSPAWELTRASGFIAERARAPEAITDGLREPILPSSPSWLIYSDSWTASRRPNYSSAYSCLWLQTLRSPLLEKMGERIPLGQHVFALLSLPSHYTRCASLALGAVGTVAIIPISKCVPSILSDVVS